MSVSVYLSVSVYRCSERFVQFRSFRRWEALHSEACRWHFIKENWISSLHSIEDQHLLHEASTLSRLSHCNIQSFGCAEGLQYLDLLHQDLGEVSWAHRRQHGPAWPPCGDWWRSGATRSWVQCQQWRPLPEMGWSLRHKFLQLAAPELLSHRLYKTFG